MGKYIEVLDGAQVACVYGTVTAKTIKGKEYKILPRDLLMMVNKHVFGINKNKELINPEHWADVCP